MKSTANLKYLDVKTLFELRDAIKILAIYFNVSLLRKIQKEIQIELEKRKEK